MSVVISLQSRAFDALSETQPARKMAATEALLSDWRADMWAGEDVSCFEPMTLDTPGHPAKPELISPREVPRRSLASGPGKAAFIHSITHIEFNATNLALDALCRFSGMPREYYADWLSVAADEARHFSMLSGRLLQLGYEYGDFPAHNGLWEMAQKTAHDVLQRMALVPRVLEARGLDVTPGMIKKLKGFGDEQSVAILETILEEEIPHVAIGSRWFRYCCEQRGCEPESTFRALLNEHMVGRLKPPFNGPARLAAGFSAAELAALEAL